MKKFSKLVILASLGVFAMVMPGCPSDDPPKLHCRTVPSEPADEVCCDLPDGGVRCSSDSQSFDFESIDISDDNFGTGGNNQG